MGRKEKPVLVRMAVYRPDKQDWIEQMKQFVERNAISWPPKWSSLDLQGDELFLQAEFYARMEDELLDQLAHVHEGSTEMYVGINLFEALKNKLMGARKGHGRPPQRP